MDKKDVDQPEQHEEEKKDAEVKDTEFKAETLNQIQDLQDQKESKAETVKAEEQAP